MKAHRFQASKASVTAFEHLRLPWISWSLFPSGKVVVHLNGGIDVLISSYLVEKEPHFECERLEGELSTSTIQAGGVVGPNKVNLVEFQDFLANEATCVTTDGVLVTHANAAQTLICCSTSSYQLQVLTAPVEIEAHLAQRRVVPIIAG